MTRTCRSCSRQWNTSAAARVGGELSRLGALEVRVEREPALVEPAQQHGARRRGAPSGATVASVIASGWRTPAATASSYQRRNCTIGSAVDGLGIERLGSAGGIHRPQRARLAAWLSTTLRSRPVTSKRPTASTPRRWASSSCRSTSSPSSRRLGAPPVLRHRQRRDARDLGSARRRHLGDFDPAISTGLGLPNFVNHIAFGASDLDELDAAQGPAGSPTATTSSASTTAGACRSTRTTRAGSWSSSAPRRTCSATRTGSEAHELLARSRPPVSTREPTDRVLRRAPAPDNAGVS